ncbi:MAG: hypothetical protein M0Z29_05255 [Actinomycetota bacterium]|nr:hypothetical protein [Actinomycetota bacterium]
MITIAWARRLLAEQLEWPWVREAIVGVVASAIVFNPWIYLTLAFDFHFQALQGFLILAAAYALYRKRYTWAWVCVVVLAISGDTGVTMIVGLVIFGFVIRASRRHLVSMLGLSLAVFLTISALDASQSSNLAGIYMYLVPAGSQRVGVLQLLGDAIARPGVLLNYVWTQRHDILANVQIYGAWALVSPAVAFLAVPFVENALAVPLFSRPGFQWAPFYLSAAIGSAMLVAYVLRRARRTVLKWMLVLLITVSDLGYSVHVWLGYHAYWHEVFVAPMNAATGRTVGKLSRRIGPSVTVIADNAVIGAFADRPIGPQMIAPVVHAASKDLLLVATPNQGVEVVPAIQQASYFWQATRLPGARVFIAQDGVYAVRWRAEPSQTSVAFQAPVSAPDALLGTGIGIAHVAGPLSQWWLSSNSTSGVILSTGQTDLAPGDVEVYLNYRSDRPLVLALVSPGGEVGGTTLPASHQWRTFHYVDNSAAVRGGGSFGLQVSEPAGATVALRGTLTFTSVPGGQQS